MSRAIAVTVNTTVERPDAEEEIHICVTGSVHLDSRRRLDYAGDCHEAEIDEIECDDGHPWDGTLTEEETRVVHELMIDRAIDHARDDRDDWRDER